MKFNNLITEKLTRKLKANYNLRSEEIDFFIDLQNYTGFYDGLWRMIADVPFSCALSPIKIAEDGHVIDLRLHNWKLTEFPETICNLERLEVLDLSYNHLKDLPYSMTNLHF